MHPRRSALAACLASALTPNPRGVGATSTLKGEIPNPDNRPGGGFLAPRCAEALPRWGAEPQALRPAADGRLVRCWRVIEEGASVAAAVPA